MTAKIKLIFGALGLIALVSVLFFYDQFRADPRFNVTEQITPIDFSTSSDQDEDGLSDAEEMIWNTDPFNPDTDGDGFKDGEEVASGHDPLKPGPDDLIDSGNATDNLTSLALAGLVEGSLKPGSPVYEKSLNDLADSIATGIRFSKPQLFTVTTLPNTTKNYENYLKSLAPVFSKFLDTFTDELNTMPDKLSLMGEYGLSEPSVVSYYASKAKTYKELTSSFETLKTPLAWKDLHIDLMEMVSGLSGASDSISKGTKDPIKAYAAMNYVSDGYTRLQDLITRIDQLIAKQGIDPHILIP